MESRALVKGLISGRRTDSSSIVTGQTVHLDTAANRLTDTVVGTRGVLTASIFLLR